MSDDPLAQIKRIAQIMGADFSEQEREAKEHQADLEKMYSLSFFQGPYTIRLSKPGAIHDAQFCLCELCGNLVYQMYTYQHRKGCEAPEE